MTFSFVVIYLPLAILFGYMGYSFAGSNLFWSVFFFLLMGVFLALSAFTAFVMHKLKNSSDDITQKKMKDWKSGKFNGNLTVKLK